ncbi:MAG TPA: LysR substrate-binding domain-containing protein [Sphingobium sp.]
MKLTHLRDFMAVVETGSLRAAARHIGIAQPVITRSIRELENELGVTFFERHAKGARLTPMGDCFARRVGTTQQELRRACEEISQMKGQDVGEVAVALSTATCMSLLPTALTAFARRYPKGIVKISESLFQPIEKDVASGRIDFWIGPLNQSEASTQFAIEKLLNNHRRIIARRGHPLQHARTLAELDGAGWVRPTLSTRNTEGDFNEIFARAGLPAPRIAVHARSSLVTMLTVAHTELLTVLPQQWVDFTPFAALIEPIKGIDPVAAAPMCIVRGQGLPLTPMAEHFCDLMRKAAHNYARANADPEQEALSSLTEERSPRLDRYDAGIRASGHTSATLVAGC